MSAKENEATLLKARFNHSYSREHLQCELLAAILDELMLARRDRERVKPPAPRIPSFLGNDNGLKDET